MENLNYAFDVAEKYLDIPRMLDPEGESRVAIASTRHLNELLRETFSLKSFFILNRSKLFN